MMTGRWTTLGRQYTNLDSCIVRRMLRLGAARNLLVLLHAGVLAMLPMALIRPFSWTMGLLSLGDLGTAPFGVVGGLVPWLLLVLVVGIGAVVATYATRNLVGQPRLARFAALEVVAVVALASAVVAPSLVQLALGWIVGGLAVAGLVGHTLTPAARRSPTSLPPGSWRVMSRCGPRWR